MSAAGTGIAVAQIVAADLLLGGDNAVVVALAARKLHGAVRRKAILFGVIAAIALRIVFIAFLIHLLRWPGVRIAGAVALIAIAVKLVQPFDAAGVESPVAAKSHLWGAVLTILVADAIMSMDNVLAIAAAAQGRTALAALGVAISVPVIIWGSGAVLWLMARAPIAIVLGSALLGAIAGRMAYADAALHRIPADGVASTLAAIAGAALVLALARLQRRRRLVRGQRHTRSPEAANR